ncbi:ferritin-4 chloroplastic-like, partial [Trifolium medium]|nr:ferritin-4 chloroplastic-like [Trifolium medium]
MSARFAVSLIAVTCNGVTKEDNRNLMEVRKRRRRKKTVVLGGKLKLQSIVMPISEFDHADKGDALH